MPIKVFAGVAVLVSTAMLACSREGEPAQTRRTFALQGQIVVIAQSLQRIAVRYDRIEGWTDATVLEFPIHNSGILSDLAVGDWISATIVQEGHMYWLDDVKVINRPRR